MQQKIGVIGLGWIANLIGGSINEYGRDRVIINAACDVDGEKLKNFKMRYGISKIYDNPDKLFEDKDIGIVVIATPPNLHYDIGKKALLAGKHVFFEKPGSLKPEDASELADIAEKNGLKNTIDYVMRRNPLYYVVKRLCDSKIYGLLERADLENYAHDDHMPPEHWFWDYSKSGGIWVEHGVHFFDLINWFIGMPVKVRALNLKRDGFELTDRVVGLAMHDGGTIVSYYHGFTKPEEFEKTTFYFTFERSYVKVSGWIPTRLKIDALCGFETESFMNDLLKEANGFLPGIHLRLSKEQIALYNDGSSKFRGRGKEFEALSRMRYEFTIDSNRWEVYRASIMAGINDLVDAVEGKKITPEVTIEDAVKALKVANSLDINAMRL